MCQDEPYIPPPGAHTNPAATGTSPTGATGGCSCRHRDRTVSAGPTSTGGGVGPEPFERRMLVGGGESAARATAPGGDVQQLEREDVPQRKQGTVRGHGSGSPAHQ
jgi:hypothetical protein